MSSVAAIGPVRVAAIQPAAPDPGLDPYEDGLDVELVTEPPVVQLVDDDRVEAVRGSTDAGVESGRRAPSAWAPAAIGSAATVLGAANAPRGPQRGNASVATGFDPTPAATLAEPARASHATSPVARAYAAFASR